jgi:hypothetical protein
MKKLTKSALITFALMTLCIAVLLAEARREKVNNFTEAYTGIKQVPYPAVVIPVSPVLY